MSIFIAVNYEPCNVQVSDNAAAGALIVLPLLKLAWVQLLTDAV